MPEVAHAGEDHGDAVPVAGVDEVGRGPLAGPVVACALADREFLALASTFGATAATAYALALQDPARHNVVRYEWAWL